MCTKIWILISTKYKFLLQLNSTHRASSNSPVVVRQMCQSRLSFLISHWIHEMILMSAFRWLDQKEWYGTSFEFEFLLFLQKICFI